MIDKTRTVFASKQDNGQWKLYQIYLTKQNIWEQLILAENISDKETAQFIADAVSAATVGSWISLSQALKEEK